MFKPVFFSVIKKYKKQTFISDLGAGLIVGIVALPLAVAFAIASGVQPEVGLVTAVIAGFFISFLSGNKVQIGGPSGALIVVIYSIVSQYGMEGVVTASILAGLMLIIMGLLKAGSIIQFMPFPVVIGFTSGIALMIFTSQIKEFIGLPDGSLPPGMIDKWFYYFTHLHQLNWITTGVSVLALLITIAWPYVMRKIPGSLIAIVVTTALVYVLQLPVATIGSSYGSLSASFSLPNLTGIDLELIRVMLVPAFTIAILCSIESLLSAMVADGATGFRTRPNTELISHGIANILSPLFGGMAASGALAKTMTNVRNGGKTPVAGMIHAVVLLVFLLYLSRLAKLIPLSALSAVLLVVAYNMSEWRSFKHILKSSKSEMVVLLTTFLLTVFVGLNIALPFGIIMALLLFVMRVMETSDIEVLKHAVEDERSYLSDEGETLEIPKGVEVFQIKGPFFFGIANKFDQAEKEIHEQPRVRIIRMLRVPFIDTTGLRNLRSFIKRSRKRHTHVILSGITEKTMMALIKDGLVNEIGAENVCDNIEEAMQRANSLISTKKRVGR
jgi:sulfate permease, SulP family